MRDPVGLVEGYRASRTDQRHRLGDYLFRIRDVDKDQASGREVEAVAGQPCRSCVGPDDLDIVKRAFAHEPLRQLHSLRAALNPDYCSGRTNSLREEVKTATRTATDLNHRCSRPEADLVEQPVCLVRQQLPLLLQPLLLLASVAKEVFVAVSHDSPPGI